MTISQNSAVVLLSGGMDSAVCAALAIERGLEPHALTILYGQRHRIEVEAAKRIVSSLRITRHILQMLDLRMFGGSALTDDIEVPKAGCVTGSDSEIPVTYVPARNTIFLAVALGHAEALGASDLFIGVNALDYSGYPDCRPSFIKAFQQVADLGTRAGAEGRPITIHTPLIDMDKAAIILEGVRLGVDLSLTHSCYDPAEDGLACGLCDSCVLRKSGFESAGVTDPIRYA